MAHPCADGKVAAGEIAFKFYARSHTEVIVVLAVQYLVECAGSLFSVAVLPQTGQLRVHIRTYMPGHVLCRV